MWFSFYFIRISPNGLNQEKQRLFMIFQAQNARLLLTRSAS